jgi:hypothetical protein
VHDDACGVEDASQPRPEGQLELGLDPCGEIAGRKARENVLPSSLERTACRLDDGVPSVPGGKRRDALVSDQPIDRRKLAQRVRAHRS